MIERLVELGLVEKRPHPDSRREIALSLTPEGTLRIRKEDMVRDARKIARALGDESDLIYRAPRTQEPKAPTTIDTITSWLRPDLAQRSSARGRGRN